MTRFAKVYCLIAMFLAFDFIAGIFMELSNIHFDALMLISGTLYSAWLPVSVISCVIFLVQHRKYLALSSGSYAAYVVVNYLATPDNLSKVTLNAATMSGLIFFAVYGLGNAYLFKQITTQDATKTRAS